MPNSLKTTHTSTPVPVHFNDVLASYHEQRADIDAAIAAVLARGDFINGRAIHEFEAAFAKYTGTAGATGVSNGTTALELLLKADGIGPGDEVITTPMTFIATAEAVSLAGAKPVFADISDETLNLDPAAAEAAITPRTRAILFVHLHGNPGGAEKCAAVARRHGLLFFEDCAQAHGARMADGSHVGSAGAGAAYSFFPAKNLGAFGDGGAVTSRNGELVERVRRLANHGRSEKYVHLVEGTNARMDTLQAALLRVKLAKLDEHVDRRNAIASRYIAGLGGLGLKFQPAAAGCRHAWHLFTVRTQRRDELQLHLKAQGVETGIHYPIPLHLQPAYAGLGWNDGAFPVAERTAMETLSLPMYPQLPEEDIDRVIRAVRAFFEG